MGSILLDSNKMLGAAFGDIAGSIYEWKNIKYKLTAEQLLNERCNVTDDTIMTIAVADGIRKAFSVIKGNWIGNIDAENIIYNEIESSLRLFGRKYIWAGYGGKFFQWLSSDNPVPYGSWGNGSAMRASYPGWIANTIEETEKLAELSACVTHNAIEGINGAKVVAGSIFILRNGGTKENVKKYAEQFFPISFTLDEIRNGYEFDVSCRGSVPQAVEAFLESDSFEETISNAISIGGDSDTIAAIAGSIAEACYSLPKEFKEFVIEKLDTFQKEILEETILFINKKENKK